MTITFDLSNEDAIKVIQFVQTITTESCSKPQLSPANESISKPISKPSTPINKSSKVQSPGKPVKMPLFGRTTNEVNNFISSEKDRLLKKEDKAKTTATKTKAKKVKAEKALEELKEPITPTKQPDVSCPWKL
jgi:hypothetical protein